MATGNESKIDTKLFVATADSIAPITKDLGNLFGEWQRALSGLRGEWQGDVSDNVKNTAAQVQKSSGELLKSLAAYQATLKEMAGIYDKTEKNVQETGRTLKFDRAMR